MDVGPLDDLLEVFAERGIGVSVMPVARGTPMGGYGSSHVYEFDGWEVGYITPGGGGEIAVAPTLAEAVAALKIERPAG